MTGERTVECIGGPMDGAAIDVAASVVLPDTISFAASLGSPRRYIYDRCAESDSFTAYRYDHFEVSA
jgi:hypothetical protein